MTASKKGFRTATADAEVPGEGRVDVPAAHPAADVLHGPFDEQVGQRAERDHDGQDPGGQQHLEREGVMMARPGVVMVDLDDQRVQQPDDVP